MEIKFTLLSHGFIENDIAWNISIPHPGEIKNKNPRAEWVRVPVFSILIYHSEIGYILYDTGPCPGDDTSRRPDLQNKLIYLDVKREELLDARLSSLNIRLEDIAMIVISHMHWDHSGGLQFFKNTKAGQNILVHKNDFSYGLTETHRSFDKPFAGGGYLKANFEFEGLSYKLIEEDQKIAKGVDLITLEGHTPGLLGLLLHLKSGSYLFPSDTVYMEKNYGPPSILPGIIYDSLGFERSIKKLNRLQDEYHAKIIFPHDYKQFCSLQKAPYFFE